MYVGVSRCVIDSVAVAYFFVTAQVQRCQCTAVWWRVYDGRRACVGISSNRHRTRLKKGSLFRLLTLIAVRNFGSKPNLATDPL